MPNPEGINNPSVETGGSNLVDHVNSETGEVTRVPVNPVNNEGYQDGAMAAALQKAGITPETFTKPIEITPTSPTPQEKPIQEKRKEPTTYIDKPLDWNLRIEAMNKAVKPATEAVETQKDTATVATIPPTPETKPIKEEQGIEKKIQEVAEQSQAMRKKVDADVKKVEQAVQDFNKKADDILRNSQESNTGKNIRRETNTVTPTTTQKGTTDEGWIDVPPISPKPSTPPNSFQEKKQSNDGWIEVPPIPQQTPTEYLRNQSGSERKEVVPKYDLRSLDERLREIGQSIANEKGKTIQEPKSKYSHIWEFKDGETPVSIVEKYNPEMRKNILEGREKQGSYYARNRDKNVDSSDLLGARQNEQSVRQQAERIKISNYIKEYEEGLKNGRELTDEEVETLKEEHMKTLPEYKKAYDEYKSKGLTDDEVHLLLQNRFSKELNAFEKTLKDKDGKFTSKNCSKEAIDALVTERKKEVMADYQAYREYRNKVNNEGRIDAATEQEKLAFKNKYGFELTPETGRLVQLLEEYDRNQKQLVEDMHRMQEQQKERERLEQEAREKERRLKKWAIVAGVAGAATAIIGGATVGGYAILGGAVVTGVAGLTKWIGGKRIEKLTERIGQAQSADEKAKLEQKLARWQKVVNIMDGTMKIARGFTTGAGIGTAISSMFMGGKGAIELIQAKINQPGIAGTIQQPAVETGSIQQPAVETGSIQQPAIETGSIQQPHIESLSEGVLVQNGRVNLPGSAWNTNLATPPVGGAENISSSFAGGSTNMGAWNLEQDLISSGITRGSLTSNLTTPQIHSLLNTYQANPSTNLVTALENLGTDGARTLAQMITGN